MEFSEIMEKAVLEGRQALDNCKPTPVTFYEADLFTDKKIGEEFYVPEGDCGGAYLIIWDYRHPFIKFCKKNYPDLIDKNMGKGYTLSTTPARSHYRGQSAERYEACANAMAKVFKENGIHCSVRAYLT